MTPFHPAPYSPLAKMPTDEHAPQAVHAVDRDRADRIVDAARLPEEDADHDQPAAISRSRAPPRDRRRRTAP
jgi:hypothetical protein